MHLRINNGVDAAEYIALRRSPIFSDAEGVMP